MKINIDDRDRPKQCFMYGVRARFKYCPKIMLDLRKITGLTENEIIIELEKLKLNEKDVKNFYLATGKFPSKIEDKFISEHGFENWYNAFRSGLINAT